VLRRVVYSVWLVGLAACAWGASAERDVRLARLALEDGFYALADRTLRSVMVSSDVTGTDAASAAHYILLSHAEQERIQALRDDLATFEQQRVLSPEAAAYWRAVADYAEAHWVSVIAGLSGKDGQSALKPPSVYAAAGLRLKAIAYAKMGDQASALSIFETLVKTFANTATAAENRLDWGRLLLSQGRLQDAQAAWAPLTTVRPSMLPASLAAEASLLAGSVHLQTGAVATAESLLQPLVGSEVMDERLRLNAVFMLAEGRLQLADAPGGRTLLTNAIPLIKIPELQKQARAGLARYLLSAGLVDDAAVAVRDVVGAYSDDPLAESLLYRLGEVMLQSGRPADADAVFMQYLEAFGDDTGMAYRGRGLALAGLKRHAEAALMFERAGALQGDSDERNDSLFRAGDNYVENQQFQKALDAYQRLLGQLAQESTQTPRLRYQCATCLAALGKVDEAIAEFEALAQAYPAQPEAGEARLSIGDLYLESGRYEQAQGAFALTMETYPQGTVFWRALHGRGMARYHLWSPDAINDFERLTREATESTMAEHAHFMQAMCMYRLGRDAAALDLGRSFRTRYPNSQWAAPVHFWIARFVYNTGNDIEAETEFLTFVQKFPEHELAPQALLRAGLAALRRQQYLQAIESFGRLAKQYPQSELLTEARFHQAEAMVQLGRFAAAIIVYEEVINRDPDGELAAMAWGRKGDCQFTLGAESALRYEEAVQSYLAVLNMPGLRLDHALQASYKLGLAYEKLGRQDEALEQYYQRVMLPFLVEKESGGIPGESARVWFSRAARGAAAIVEVRKDWRQLVRILERAVSAEVEFSTDAAVRIKAVKSEYWWMFY